MSIRRRSYYPGHAVTRPVWALPLSLATTRGITVVFFSCGYLDVSVPRVRLTLSVMSPEPVTGFPIRISADQVVFADPRGFSQLITSFFASGSHRHPPCALFRFPFVLHNGYATPAPLMAQARISIIQSFAFLLTLESLAAASNAAAACI